MAVRRGRREVGDAMRSPEEGDGAVGVFVEAHRHPDEVRPQPGGGDLLDYAANGTAYWQAGRIADSFAQTASVEGVDPDERLAEFMHADQNDKGHAVLVGGTGKFAGITGEHAITTTWFSSIREGENQGVGDEERPLEARGDVTRAGSRAKRLAGLVPRD